MVVAHVTGELDIAGAPHAGERIAEAVPTSARGLVVDMSELDFIDSSGVAMLFGLVRRLSSRRQELRVVAPKGKPVARVLEIVEFERAAPTLRRRRARAGGDRLGRHGLARRAVARVVPASTPPAGGRSPAGRVLARPANLGRLALLHGEGVRHRRGLVGDRLVSGTAGARDRLRLLREGLRRRRQLALRQRQRHVVRVPLALHQHLAADDAVRQLPDAGRLPGLSAPRADSRLLRRLRRPLRLPRPDPLQHRGRADRAGRRGALDGHDQRRRVGRLRRRVRRERPPLEPEMARAALPGPGDLHRRAAPLAPLPRAGRALRGEARARARHRQLRDRHLRRDLASHRDDLPGHASRRARDPQVHRGQADRRARAALDVAPAVPGHALVLHAPAEADPGQDGGLRAAEARPQARRGTSHDLLGPAVADRPRAHHPEAEHRAHRRRDGALRGRLERRDRHDRLVHRLPDHVPVPRLRGDDERRQPRAALPARGAPRPPGALLHRAGAAARRDHADRRAPGRSGSATSSRGRCRSRTLPRCVPRSPPRRPRMRRRYVASTRHTIQVDFHPYMRLLREERGRSEGVRHPLGRPAALERPAPAAS